VINKEVTLISIFPVIDFIELLIHVQLGTPVVTTVSLSIEIVQYCSDLALVFS
jgi:hypothetical protein